MMLHVYVHTDIQFILFAEVMFCKVPADTIRERGTFAPRRNTGLGACKPLVTTVHQPLST